MVIISSDSNNTLVSLDHGFSNNNNSNKSLKRIGSLELLQQAAVAHHQHEQQQQHHVPEFVPTALWLPSHQHNDDHDDCYDCETVCSDDEDDWCHTSSHDDDDSAFHSCASQHYHQEPLYLPKQQQQQQEAQNVMTPEECISYLPCLLDAAETLTAPIQEAASSPPSSGAPAAVAHYGANSPSRFVYVGQGEVGHAVPLQTDLILSDRATTCHILMLYSTSPHNMPLATCAHLDGVNYADCVRDMFEKHKLHHQGFEREEEKKQQEEDLAPEEQAQPDIHVDIHIAGGFQVASDSSSCSSSSSSQLSNWLLYTLADLASDYANCLHCTLQTAAMSRLNTCRRTGGPLIRGLALSLRTGQVHACAVPDTADCGPDFCLRQARLWCPRDQQDSKHLLTTVFHERSNVYQVQPFSMPSASLDAEYKALLQLPSDVLLQCTSTSPQYEDAHDFVRTVRATIVCLMTAQPNEAFGNGGRCLWYKRIGNSNGWRKLG